MQVSISNTIGSLRFLGSMDWRDFVESMSAVEKKLRDDPGGLYGRMDFSTRDRYRHRREIAKGSTRSESEIARKAIQLAYENATASAGAAGTTTARRTSALSRRQRPASARACDKGAIRSHKRCNDGRRSPLLFYLGGIMAITGTLTGRWWRGSR